MAEFDLINLSTITHRQSNPLEGGILSIKFMVMLIHGLEGIGSGCKRPQRVCFHF